MVSEDFLCFGVMIRKYQSVNPKGYNKIRLYLLVAAILSCGLISYWWLMNRFGWWISLVAIGLIVWVSIIETSWLKTKIIRVTSPKVKQPFKIFQISDFHTNQRVIKQIIRQIELQQPDIIVLTGDIFDGERRNNRAAEQLLLALPKQIPQFIIWGNHEIDFPQTLQHARQFVVDQTNCRLANQQTIDINEEVALSGADFQKQPRKLPAINHDKFNLLLTHTPKGAAYYARYGFDLILCGHEHGGQVRLPIIGAVIDARCCPFPEIFGHPMSGLNSLNKTNIYICSGAGVSAQPLRFLCRVQVSVIIVSDR